MNNIVGQSNNLHVNPSVDDFIRVGKEAGASGKVIMSETDDGQVIVVVAKEKLKDYALSFLKYFPILKNTNAVRKALQNIENININSKMALALFANALSKSYGTVEATVATSPYFNGKKEISLNLENIRDMKETAQIYHGIGAARNHSRKVTINLWPYENMNKGGHASITIKNKDNGQQAHISWWPTSELDKPLNNDDISIVARAIDGVVPKKLELELASNFQDKFGGTLENYKEDKNAEIGTADKKMVAGEKARVAIMQRAIEGTWDVKTPPPYTKKKREALQKEINKLYAEAKDKAEKEPEKSAKIIKKADDLKLLLESSYKPNATQIKEKQGNWGAVAQKINFPMVGESTIREAGSIKSSKFVMFGLSEAAIFADAEYVKKNAEAYENLQKAQDKFNDPDVEKLDEKLERLNENQGKIDSLKVKISNYRESLGNIEGNVGKYEKEIERLKKIPGKSPEEKQAIGEANRQLNHAKEQLKRMPGIEKELLEAEEKLLKAEMKSIAIKENSFENKLIAAQNQARLAGDEIGYKFASNDNNCASMAVRVLRAGGADNYVPMPKMRNYLMDVIAPDKQFSDYAKSVQEKIDMLNDKADFVFSQLDKRSPAIDDAAVTSKQEIEELRTSYTSAFGFLNESDEAYSSGIINIISDNLPVAEDDSKSLNIKTMSIVTAAEEFFKKTPSNGEPSPVEIEMNTVLRAVLNMHKQKITELNNPSVIEDKFNSN